MSEPSVAQALRASAARHLPSWRTALAWHRPLMVFAAANAVLVVIASIGLAVDDRVLVGAPLWLKPAKFALSFVLFGTTLAWMISLLHRRRRLGALLGSAVALAGVFEMTIIVGQAARGQQSHFNTTTPFSGALYAIMGGTIVALWVSTLVVAVLLTREPLGDRVLALAIRLGIAVSLVGMATAFSMTSPTTAQAEALGRGDVSLTGAHSVGVLDGGPGMPLTGWATTGGDLRVGHFVGLHALQGIPLLALGLGVLALAGRRWRWLRDERTRRGLVVTAAAAWLGLVTLLFWQAQRGQPLLAPDAVTLIALAALLIATAIAIAAILARGHGRATACSIPRVR